MTTEAAFLDTRERALLDCIRERPDDDAPRLVLADWLEERGETARAEFIQIQVKMAAKADPQCRHRHVEKLVTSGLRPVRPLVYETFDTPDSMTFTTRFLPCERCYPTLRRRETELLKAHGKAWAGKLQGHDAFVWADLTQWHVGWKWGAGKAAIDARFVRGFPAIFSLPCAALVGGRCETCQGRKFDPNDECKVCGNRPDEDGQINHGKGCYHLDENGGGSKQADDCPACSGSGHRPGLAAALGGLPLEAAGIVLSDKRPVCTGNPPTGVAGWWMITDEAVRPNNGGLPQELWVLLDGQKADLNEYRWKWYATADLATAALRAATMIFAARAYAAGGGT